MRREFLRRLHCPYSGSPFSFSQIVEEDTTHIQYGIVTSEAGEFPIVSGILRLQPDEYRLPIVENIREKHLSNALSIALDDGPLHWHGGAAINFAMRLAFRSGFSVAAMRLNRLKRNFTRVITDGSATFKEIAEKLSRGASSGWQVFRFSMPTFLPVFAVSHIVKHDCLILDFGSGAGQASFVIRQMFSGSDIVCADYSFSALYLAQKYFVPSACHTCLDGNYPLPFDSGEFSTVFSSDTLHCIDSKLSLAQEFMRVGSENAVTILPHVHNRQVSPYAKSLTPNGYRGLFRNVQTRIVSEEEVIMSYFLDDVVDLTKDSSDEDLAASKQGLAIVASNDPSVFERREKLWDQRIHSFRNPRINPAYQVTGQPGEWTLARHASERYFKTVSSSERVCLPDSCKVRARSLDASGLAELQRCDRSQFAELARALVVLDLPERFMPAVATQQ